MALCSILLSVLASIAEIGGAWLVRLGVCEQPKQAYTPTRATRVENETSTTNNPKHSPFNKPTTQPPATRPLNENALTSASIRPQFSKCI